VTVGGGGSGGSGGIGRLQRIGPVAGGGAEARHPGILGHQVVQHRGQQVGVAGAGAQVAGGDAARRQEAAQQVARAGHPAQRLQCHRLGLFPPAHRVPPPPRPAGRRTERHS